MKTWRESTKSIHSGEEKKINGAVVTPIFQSAMYEFANEAQYDDIQYMRCNNTTNHIVLGEKIAALEDAEAGLVTASGMAAISSALLAFLPVGSHGLFHNNLYGGTHALVTEDLPQHGVNHSFVDASAPETWENQINDNTKVFYVESLSNPLMQVADLKAVVEFSKKHNLVSIIDNTFMTPTLFKPMDLGFDIVVHSATKYLNGHSDIVAGATVATAENLKKIVHKLNHLGGSLDAHACFLLQRGIKTLNLRMERHCQNALALAQNLQATDKVKSVNYPGLENNSHFPRAKELFKGFGGMLSFELDATPKQVEKFIAALKLPMHAPSLGGVESLITRPATSSHLCIPREDRLAIGISDQLLRFSVGLENIEDLIEDLDQALNKL